jgi:copper chaperone CopZ
MEKVFKLNELDCANCAAKMERAIKKIKGVKSVSVNFMTQKAFIEANEEEFERIIKEADSAVKKIDKEVSIITV